MKGIPFALELCADQEEEVKREMEREEEEGKEVEEEKREEWTMRWWEREGGIQSWGRW